MLTAGVWHRPVQQAEGQLFAALHHHQCLKTGESQTEIHSRSGMNSVRLLFRLIGLYYLFFAATSTSIIFSGLNDIRLLCFLRSQPRLLSFAEGNTPTPHPETSQINQNIKIQAEGRGSADTVATAHLGAHKWWFNCITFMSIFCFLGKCYYLSSSCSSNVLHRWFANGVA